jgi:hypothetical protein
MKGEQKGREDREDESFRVLLVPFISQPTICIIHLNCGGHRIPLSVHRAGEMPAPQELVEYFLIWKSLRKNFDNNLILRQTSE